MTTTKVRFFTNRRWAPCDVLVQIMDEDLLAHVKAVVKENGGYREPVSLLWDPNDTTLVNWEDLRYEDDGQVVFLPYFTQELYDELNRVGSVDIEMDAFDAAALYGYSAHDELLQRGVIK